MRNWLGDSRRDGGDRTEAGVPLPRDITGLGGQSHMAYPGASNVWFCSYFFISDRLSRTNTGSAGVNESCTFGAHSPVGNPSTTLHVPAVLAAMTEMCPPSLKTKQGSLSPVVANRTTETKQHVRLTWEVQESWTVRRKSAGHLIHRHGETDMASTSQGLGKGLSV